MNRTSPYLWAAGGGLFLLAAWLGDSIAFVGIGVMFILFGVAAWLNARKKDEQ